MSIQETKQYYSRKKKPETIQETFKKMDLKGIKLKHLRYFEIILNEYLQNSLGGNQHIKLKLKEVRELIEQKVEYGKSKKRDNYKEESI